MNERIIELRKEAYNLVQIDLQTNWHDESVDSREHLKMVFEKFAELIVRECVEQIQICSEQIKNDDVYADDNIWPIMQSIVDAVAIDVKQHFGVDE